MSSGAPPKGVDGLILRMKRGESAPYRLLRRMARAFFNPRPPRLPAILKPLARAAYELHFVAIVAARWLINFLWVHPLFQGRCASFGKNVIVDTLPFVSGHVEIHIGDNVHLGGHISIVSGRIFDNPKLIIKDHAEIGWNATLVVNREVTIEEHARVSYDCRISDSDGHPREADLRARNVPPDPRDVRPVRICRHAWLGNGSHILKGVTIGEGAIIGANSVVIMPIPPYALAMGNPAEVYFPNAGRPKRRPGAADEDQADGHRTSTAPQE
jgi:acetyltransferase-like isoleucine patch superfamily enzyme